MGAKAFGLKQVREQVELIRQNADDFEAAHGAEDALRFTVLKAIAEGVKNPEKLAAAALETSSIDFPRPCA